MKIVHSREPDGGASRPAHLGALACLLGWVLLLSAAPGFRVLDLQPSGTNQAWRVRWTATPGAIYELQRLAGDSFPNDGNARWVSLAAVRATHDLASAEDVAGAGVRQRFYRVVQVMPVFRIIDIVQLGETNAYRIRWHAVAGRDYQLQRPASDTLPALPQFEWWPVATVRATGDVASVEDTVQPGVRQRFYRVALLPDAGGDQLPPTVALQAARVVSSNGAAALRLEFLAGDDVAVAGVTVREGSLVLGEATRVGGSNWVFNVPVDLEALQARHFSATASDASGKQADTGPIGLLPARPDWFAPVSPEGLPLEQHALRLSSSNQLGAFVYRPGGRPRPGYAPDFFLRFPEGATFEHATNGLSVLVFVRAVAGFDPDSPFQLAAPLERASGPPVRLTVGPLAFTDLAAVFGLDPTNGIPIRVFGRHALRWRGGVLDDRGLVGAQFRSEMRDLPLPAWSAAFTNYLVDLSQDRALRIPFAGQFELPDPLQVPARLGIPSGRPCWLTLKPEGEPTLDGAVELMISSNFNGRAHLRLEEPKYHLTLSTPSLRYRGLTNLAPFLPGDPDQCVQSGLGQYARAQRCLQGSTEAYAHFAAAVGECAASAPPAQLPLPPSLNPLADVLEAWSYSALARPDASPSREPVASLAAQTGLQAAAAPELLETVGARLALLRCRWALTVSGAPPDDLAVVSNALQWAETAALDRAEAARAGLPLETMVQLARWLVESDALRQSNNLPRGPLEESALPELFPDLARQLCDAWGVTSGVFTPENNLRIRALPRPETMETLRRVVAFQSRAAALSSPLTATPMAELAGQLGVRALETVDTAMLASSHARETPAYALAARDYVDLVAWAREGYLPDLPELAALRSGAGLTLLRNQLGALLEADVERPGSPVSLGRHAADLRALLALVRGVPDASALPRPPLEDLYRRVDAQLAARPAATESNLVRLLEWIEAGTLHRELAQRFNIAPVGDPEQVGWERVRLPQVAGQLAAVAKPARAWRELDQGVRLLLDAADRVGLDTPLGIALRNQAPLLLTASREVALGLMTDAGGQLRRVDLVLPGDTQLDEPAGSIVYHRLSGQLHGALRGRLRLPALGLDLTVPQASLDSGGRFDLSAYGTLQFDGGRIEVPVRMPLHVWHAPERGLSFEGGTRLVLDNGLNLDAYAGLTDPLYRFAVAARGIEFNLSRELMAQRPVLSASAVNGFTEEARNALADYLRHLNGSLETLLTRAGLVPGVDTATPGRPPELAAPEITLDFASLNAWAADVLLRARGGLSQATLATLAPLWDAVRRLNREAEIARTTLGDERTRLAHLASRLALRRQIKTAVSALVDPGADFNALLQEVEAGLRQEASNVAAQVTPDVAGRLPDALDLVRLLTETEAAFQEFGLAEGEGSLPSDPCAAMTHAAATLGQRAEALTACAAVRHALDLGLDPASGAVTDTNRFERLTSDQLEQSLVVLLELEVLLQQRGQTATTVLPVAAPVVRRQRELLRHELAQSTSLSQQFELMGRLLDNVTWSQSLDALTSLDELNPVMAAITNTAAQVFRDVGSNPQKARQVMQAREEAQQARNNRQRQRTSEVRRALGRDRAVRLVGPDAEYVPDFFTQLADFLRLLRERGATLTPGSWTDTEGLVRSLAADLRARPVTADFLTNRMQQAEALLGGIVGLTDWAGRYQTNDVRTLTNLQFALTNLTTVFNGVAEAQKAWWLLDRYQEHLRRHAAAYGTNVAAQLHDALRQARAATLLTSRRVTEALNPLFSQVRFQDVVVTLPGGVEIRSIYGRLQYDRGRAEFEGCFGGRLEFPEVNTNMFFEITQACLASDGSFSLVSTNRTSLPFDGVRLAAGVNVSGSAQGVATFRGSGTLWVPHGPAGDQAFQVALSYDQEARRMGFDAQGRDLNLALGPDFVLFNAALGFDVSLAQPGGRFRVSGSAGLIARDRGAPPPSHPSPTNYHLVVTNLTTLFVYSNETFSLILSNGMLLLPEWFRGSGEGLCAGGTQPPPGPAVQLVPANPIAVRIVTGDPPQAFFSGAIDIRNIGFTVPGLDDVDVAVCAARLVFPTNDLPRLTNLTASIRIPLPHATSRVDLVNAAWSVDGWPTGTIRLGQNLPLFEAGNFSFVLLGTNQTLCPDGTGFTIQRLTNHATALSLFGGIGVGLDESSLAWVDGTKLFAQACGRVVLRSEAPPALHLEGLGLAGDFRLGGSGGVKLEDARLELRHVESFFQENPTEPFSLQLFGTITIPYGPGLILDEAHFTFAGGEPRFTVRGLTLINRPFALSSPWDGAFAALPAAGGAHRYEPVEGLFLDVSAVGIAFLDPNLRLPRLLNPENIRLTVSASLNLPPEDPLFFARVDGLTLHWTNDTLQASLSGVGLGFDNLDFPPLTLKGIVYVGGFNPADVFHSPNLFFAGQVGGKIEDVGVLATLAVTPRGILGVCLDVNAGPAGIPIDGGALGGVLLTGAAGGVTFTNASDPCDFMSYIVIPGGGAPAGPAPMPLPLAPRTVTGMGVPASSPLPRELITWSQLAAVQRREALEARLATAPALRVASAEGAPLAPPAVPGNAEGHSPEAPCLLAPCPPPTISLLCQPHPDQARHSNQVILKFTSLNEAQLNALGVTRELVTTFGGTAEEVGQNVAAVIRGAIDGLLPRAESGGLLSPQQVFELNTGITNLLNDVQAGFAGLIRDGVQGALGNQDEVYQAILDAAYAGVPCPSVVVKLSGTLSHAVVSTFLSGTVGTILSSDGSAGVVGSLNLVGIPVGKLRGFVALSDARGNPNPSLCGQVEAALGPLELGILQGLYSCDGCADGLGAAFLGLGGCLGAQGDVIIHEIAGRIAPDLPTSQLTSPQVLLALSTNGPRMAAFMAELFRHPSLPPGLPECFLQAMGAAWDSLQPRILVCGEAQPRLFGIPLMGEIGSVYLEAAKGSLVARVGMSPSYLLGNTLLCLGTSGTLCQGVFPAIDEGSVGFGLGIPDPGRFLLAGLSGDLNSPAALGAYLEDGFAYMLQEGTFTLTYKLNPFGFEIANAQGRVILPYLTQPPACGGGYVRPEDRGLPSRLELLLWANATNLLGNPAWKGDSNTLAWVFPEGDPRRAHVQGLTLSRDYFPYGGVAGAMRLQMPKALVDAPPPVLGRIFENRPVLERLSAAADYISGYVLSGSEVGMLAFYVPAPNPPCLPGLPTPRQLLEAMSKFDPRAMTPPDLYPQGPYPLAEGFLRGYLDGRLLGVPLVQATLTLVPPEDNQPGYFLGEAQIPPGSWMSDFLDSARATFEIRQSPALPINTAFSNLLGQVTQATNSGQVQVMNSLAAGLGDFLTTNLPKVALHVAVSNLHIPNALTNVITAGGTANFFAYSPWYDPSFAGVGPVADARRNGGIALQGQMRFADFITVNNAELAVSLAEGVPLPALSGLFDVPVLEVPGLPLRNARFAFDSDPAVGQAYLAARGELDPIAFLHPVTLQPLLTIQNLTNAGARLAADFSLVRPSSGPPLPGFAISPSRVDMPMLGPGLVVRLHGTTTNDPFAFSSTGPWSARVSITGQLRIRGPLSNDVVRIGAAGAGFAAELSGHGMQMDRLAITLPAGVTLVAFPGTSSQQTFTFGNPGGTNRLEIASDGTFLLHGELGGTLNLSGLGFSSISAGASFQLTESALTVTGTFNGGALDHVENLPSASGTFTVTRSGVTISGSVSVPAFSLGVFLVSGGNGGPIGASLNNAGLALTTGAKLRLLAAGYPDQDLFTLNAFTIAANGDFQVSAQSGALNLPGYLNLTGGSFTLKRTAGVASLAMHAPTLTVFPNATFPSTSITAPFTDVTMSSDGRFYANTGLRGLALPAGFGASGQLEIGYEPDPRQPALSVSTAPINFGTVNYGSSSNRILNLQNTGNGLLKATITSSNPAAFNVTPFNLTIEPGQTASVSVRFTPAGAGAASSALTILHNAPGGSPAIQVSGSGRAVPVLRLSATNLAFNEVQVNQASRLYLRVDNLGLSSLSVTASGATAPFAATPGTFTVAPGSYTLVAVTFAPTAAGAATRTLGFSSNDPNGNQSVALSGTGYQSQWYLQREGGSGLNVIALNSSGRGFAAGEGGAILQTLNAGHSWSLARLLRSDKLYREATTLKAGALAEDGNHGVLAGAAGRVYITADSGATWTRHVSSMAGDSTAVWTAAGYVPGTRRHVLAGSYVSSGFTRHVIAVAQNDSGTAYSTNAAILSRIYNGVAAATVGAQAIILVGGETLTYPANGLVMRSTNGGTNWSLISLESGAGGVRGVRLLASGTALLVTGTGRIYQSADSGGTWTLRSTGKGTLQDVAFTGTTVAYAVNREGEIYRSVASGGLFSAWTKEEMGLDDLRRLTSDATRAWCAGSGGRIYHRPGYSLDNGILTFEPSVLSYGFVPVGDSTPRVLTLYNRGRAGLVINGFTPSPASLASELVYNPAPPVTIQAGQKLEMSVSYRPTTTNQFTADLVIFNTDPAGNAAAGLSGRSATHGWVLQAPVPNGSGQTAVDVQLVSDTVGYAITPSRAYKTVDAGGTWTELSLPTTDPLSALHFVSTTTGFVGGGALSSRTSSSFILRTIDGGVSWSTVYSALNHPVANVHCADATTGYAVTLANELTPTPTWGNVLRSTNGGVSWLTCPKPTVLFSAAALHAVSATEVFVSDGNRLYRSADGGQTWTTVITNAGATLRVVHFDGSWGWAGGDSGTLWRTLFGGDTAAEWFSGVSPGAEAINGYSTVLHYLGWLTVSSDAPSARIYRTDTGGDAWREELGESPYSGPGTLKPTVISARSSALAVALGTDGCVRRYQPFVSEPAGIAVAPPVCDFGAALVGQQIAGSFALRNAGTRDLVVSRVAVDGSDPGNGDFKVTTSLPLSIRPGNSGTISLVAYNRAAGLCSANLDLVTDGIDPNVSVELRSTAVAPPSVVAFKTDPPGLSVTIDGVTRVAPLAFTVRQGASGPADWEQDSLHDITVATNQTVNGQQFHFVAWSPAEERTFTCSAGATSVTYLARFVAGGSDDAGAGDGLAGPAAAPSPVPGGGVTTGPYLRLSNASLTNPWLGNFTASGAALLSANLMDVSLQTTPVVLRASPGVAPVAEITASAWRFLYSNSVVRLGAQSPALRLVGTAVTPPSTLELTFNSSGHFWGNFSLPQGWPVAPGLLEFGASSLTLAHTNFFHLSSVGPVRVLRKPDGDWAYQPTMTLNFRDGPFTNSVTLPSSVMQLFLPGTSTEFLEVRGGAGSQFELRRDNTSVFTAELKNVGLDFLGQAVGTFTGTASSSGQITFSITNTASPFLLGPFRWHAAGTSMFRWNVKNGALSLSLPAGTLKDEGVSVPGWPDAGLAFPGITLDSQGDFAHTMPLPAFTFDGITLGNAADAADRSVVFRRDNGVLSLALRDQQEFFGSSMSLGFDIASSGSASGFFKGSFGVDFPAPLGYVSFGAVNLGYRTGCADSNYQFCGDVRIVGNTFRVRFGSAGGRVCHQWCGSGDCVPAVCVP